MKSFKAVFDVNFKQYFRFTKGVKRSKGEIIGWSSLGIVVLLFTAIMCFGIYSMIAQLNELGAAHSLLTLIMSGAQVMVVFFGLAVYISVMINSKDNEFLLGLPIKTTHIYLSKMSVVYTSQLALSTIILLPVLVITAIALKITAISYYLYAIVAIFFVPLIPLLIISILSLPIAYIMNFFKRNSMAGTILGALALLAFMCGYMYLVIGMQTGGEGTDIPAMVVSFNTFAKFLYPNYVLSLALIGGANSFGNFAIFVGIVFACGAVALVFSMLFYRKVASKALETYSKKNAKAKDYTVSKSQVKALLTRDLKCLTRDSSMAINSLIGALMAPLMTIVMGIAFTGFADMSELAAMGMPLLMGGMMASMTNYIAIFGISREGDKFYIIKYLPVTPQNYIKAKLLLSDCYLGICAILCGIAMAVTGVDILNSVLCALFMFMTNASIGAFALLVDVKSPKLDWLNFRQLSRRNMKQFKAMIISMAVYMVLYILAIVLSMFKLGIYAYVILYSIWGVIAIAGLLIFRRNFNSKALNNLMNIEVYTS